MTASSGPFWPSSTKTRMGQTHNLSLTWQPIINPLYAFLNSSMLFFERGRTLWNYRISHRENVFPNLFQICINVSALNSTWPVYSPWPTRPWGEVSFVFIKRGKDWAPFVRHCSPVEKHSNGGKVSISLMTGGLWRRAVEMSQSFIVKTPSAICGKLEMNFSQSRLAVEHERAVERGLYRTNKKRSNLLWGRLCAKIIKGKHAGHVH